MRTIKIGDTGVCKGRKNTVNEGKTFKFEVSGLADGMTCSVKLDNGEETQIYVYGWIDNGVLLSNFTGQTTSLDETLKNFKFNK